MKLGIAVNHLGPSQLAYAIAKNIHELLVKEPGVDVCVFYENATKPSFPPNCAIMPFVEAWHFDGVLINTTLSTAEKSLTFAGPRRKLFYVWDLEWLRFQQKEYRQSQAIYGHERLELLARSADHKQILESLWNRPVAAVVEDFDLLKILANIGNDQCQK